MSRFRAVMVADGLPRRSRILITAAALSIAAAIWLVSVHLLFTSRLDRFRVPDGVSRDSRALAQRHLDLWTRPEARAEEIRKMRASNAEWDFMARTYFVLALANLSLREPERKGRYVGVIDEILDETVRLEKENGILFFLMDYARQGSFRSGTNRSLFIDGEIALMLAARRFVEERDDYKPMLKERVDAMLDYMSRSSVLSGESYPDECWIFCNAVALAALRMHDVLDAADHSEFIRRWIATAKEKLVDKKTGLLLASYTYGGTPQRGPEGSSIWMAAHCLQIVDEPFAKDQYERAKRELARRVLGFGYAKEWPPTWRGDAGVDSGPIVPILEVSAGSSGMAFLGAASFEDGEFLTSLLTTLDFAAFPVTHHGGLKYAASNQVGDAVLLYSGVMGPLWKKVRDGRR